MAQPYNGGFNPGDYMRDTHDTDTGSRLPAVEKYEMSMEKLEEQVTDLMEKEYQPQFDRQSMFMGNGIYSIAGLYSTDTRELFLMYCLLREDLKMDDFARKMNNLRDRRQNSDTTNSFDDAMFYDKIAKSKSILTKKSKR